MDWYDARQFATKVEAIESYFIALAANEEDIRRLGFRIALQLPGAEAAQQALLSFSEDFASFKQGSERLGKAFMRELEQLDVQPKLTEQVALVSLRLRMAQARTREQMGIAEVISRAFSRGSSTKSQFGESQISLQVSCINLEKLRALTRRGSSLLQAKESSDDEIFKPSNLRSDRIVELLDAALAEIQSTTSLSQDEVARLEAYLSEARAEVQSEKPSWARIVGALVIVAAVTSGIADAPGATKTVRDAIEYILGTSTSSPLQRYLPNTAQGLAPSTASPHGAQ